jgi:hypothetical protein
MRFVKMFLVGFFLLTATQIFAQTETYDIATFTPPKDFKRQERELALSFSKVNESNGKFCIIAIYPSRQSSGALETDFQNEWQDRVAKPLSTKAKPDYERFAVPKGWEAVMGKAVVESDNGEMVTILVVQRGFGRVMSFLISINSLDFYKYVEDFVTNLELGKSSSASSNKSSSAPVRTLPANGLVGSWGDVTSGDFGVRSSSGGFSTGRGGTARGYSFKPDGTYTYTMVADIVLNGSKIQTHEAGTYKISNDTLVLSPLKLFYRRNGVDETPNADWRDPRSYRWRIEQDGAVTNLVLKTGSFEDRLMRDR